MVGLGATGSKDNIHPLVSGIRQKKLQLADLIAAQSNAGHVVPLDVNIFSDLPAQVFQLIQG